MASGIQAQGLEVIGVTRPGFPLDTMRVDRDEASHGLVDGVRYHRLYAPWRRGKNVHEYMQMCVSEYESLFRDLRPAAVLGASFYFSAIPSMIAARRLGLPYIYEVRGLAELTKLSRDPSYGASASFGETIVMDTATCMAADHVFTLTRGMQSILMERGVPAEKISIVPNSVDPEVFTTIPRDRELAESNGLPERVPVIGYVGSIVDYEGLDDLILACGMLRERGTQFRLLLVGNDNSSAGADLGPLATQLKRTADASGIGDWLVMPGRVSHTDARRYYSLIDIAPLPRKAWPVCEMVSPMKPLEALAMQKAVVVSSVAALAEMIDDGVTGLVFEKSNVAALADSLERLAGDRDLRARLGAAGRRFVQEHRSWSQSAKVAASRIEGLIQSRCG